MEVHKENNGSWVAAHSWQRLGHIKWNQTIKGRATKPVLPRQRRNEYSAAVLWLQQIKKKKLCLPGANHVHPLRYNLDEDDKQNLFHRIAGKILQNLICTVHAKFPPILSTWMADDEGAGHCFGYQFGYSRKTGQATMFMSCNWTPPSPPQVHNSCDTLTSQPAHSSSCQNTTEANSSPLPLLSSPLLSLKFASGSLKNCLLFTLNKLICIPWRKRSEVISKTTRCKQKLSAGSNGLKTLRGEVRCFCCVYMWPCE